MKLRNAKFNRCNFNNVIFNRLPKLNTGVEEGYKFVRGGIKLPLMTQDPDNVYSHICVDYTKPIGEGVHIYDEKLHQRYKKYFNGQTITNGDVYKNYWSGHEISHVDFESTTISNTIIKDINFMFGSFIDTNVSNVVFDKVEFDSITLDATIFKNYRFNHVTFTNCGLMINHFINCTFDDGYFRECVISGMNRFDNIQGKKMVFQNTKMPREMMTLFDKKEVKISMCYDRGGKLIYE